MVKIENFKIKNQQRGRATTLATFDVNLGALSIKGAELIRLDDGKTFASMPNNRYKGSDGQWKRFNFIGFNGDRGNKLIGEILKMSQEEYKRRTAGSTSQGQGFDRGYPQESQDTWDDGLPF